MYHGDDYRLHMDNRLMITYTHNAVHSKNYAWFERRVRKLAKPSNRPQYRGTLNNEVFEPSGLVTDHTAVQSGTSYKLHGFADLFVGNIIHEFKHGLREVGVFTGNKEDFDALPGQGATYYKLRNADMDWDEIREHKDMHIIKDYLPGTAREFTTLALHLVEDEDTDQVAEKSNKRTYLANPIMVLDLRKDSTLEELDQEYPFQEYEEEEEQKPLDRLLVF